MKKYIDKEDFYITDDHTFMAEEHGMTTDLFKRINKLHFDVIKSKFGTADRLIKLIQKNPKNPQLKNLLTSYYIKINQPEKAYELNRKTIALHPDNFLQNSI